MFRNAYYIKLGRAGAWEANAIASGFLRLGWEKQSLEDINGRCWDVIKAQLMEQQPGQPGVVTADLNRLRDITESTVEDVWITFHGAKLWWTRLEEGGVEADRLSKFRRCRGGWSDCSQTGRLLIVNELPGRLAMLQAFRGTVCRVREERMLARVLSGERSELAQRIEQSESELARHLLEAIRDLHWKDYETLVDLVFRSAGWERISVLGQQAKGYDLELREPLTNTRYVVQVKSQAKLADLEETARQFSGTDYRRVFFVVHSPTDDLAQAQALPAHVELVSPATLARLSISAGLVGWLRSRVS
jgi:hypothetical protein